MHFCWIHFAGQAALYVSVAVVAAAFAEEPKKASPHVVPRSEQVYEAADRGLAFLEKDAVAWRQAKTCSTCHQGLMTVWALSEARSQGYTVAPDTLTEMTTWTKERLATISQPRDTRPGWNMVNTPALYLALMAQVVPKQEAVSADGLNQIADHLVRHQEESGNWAWSLAPAANRIPPFFESDEVVTWLAYAALRPHVPADSQEKSAARDSRSNASAWLANTVFTDTTQAVAVRLLAKVLAGEQANAEIESLLGRQREDGGWAQLADRLSDAYATGQALYVLNLADLPKDRPEIQRGLAFLISTQKEDGSWPMTPRGQPGEKPASSPVPITYLGSAWGTLALVRTVPK